jgi:DNA-binding SARP family transcriptional activator
MHVGRSVPAGSVGTTHIELRLAGTFRVVRDGAELTDGEIGSRKSRTLLKLLAVERPGLVPVDRLVDVLWADPAREQVRELLHRARLAAAEAALATGDPRLAADYAAAAMTADPLDEAAHRWYMSASVAAGEQAKALAAYEALRLRLGRELGADPAPQTRELHLTILREIGALREAWRTAAAGQPRLVTIVGEAGSGRPR